MIENIQNFQLGGGQFAVVSGGPLDVVDGVITPTHLIHHIPNGGTIRKINLPYPGFSGAIVLIGGDNVFNWNNEGNIVGGSTAGAGKASILWYDPGTQKWYAS